MVPKTIQYDRIPTDIPTYVHRLTQIDEEKMRARLSQKNQNQQLNIDLQQSSLKATDDKDPTLFLLTTTSEGSAIVLDVMLQWKIIDTRLSALTAMEILKVESFGNETVDEKDAISASSKNICNLRRTVLRIAKNHLTAMVGSISLSGKSSMSVMIKEKIPAKNQVGNGQMEDIYEEDFEDESSKPLLNKNSPQKQLKTKQQKVKLSDANTTDKNGSNFDILNSLQSSSYYLKDLINKDLIKIGCVADHICIYKVTPSKEIQIELDLQTKARVDANTAIIRALSDQKSSKINQDIISRNSIIQAQSNANVILMQAKSQCEAKKTMANGQAQAIITVAEARKLEAEQLQSSQVAKNLALTRVAGEAGERVFSGANNSFVFGQNPGDVLFGMMNKFTQQKQIRQ